MNNKIVTAIFLRVNGTRMDFTSDYFLWLLVLAQCTVWRRSFEGGNFRVFRSSGPYVKVLSAKCCGHTHILIGPEQSAKVFSAKCCGHTHILIGPEQSGESLLREMLWPHPHINWTGTIGESLLREMLWPHPHINWTGTIGRKSSPRNVVATPTY